MTERSTSTPGEPEPDDGDLVGVPELPPGATALAVVNVVLYVLPDGTEGIAVAAVSAVGDDLPVTTTVGILMLAVGDIATGAALRP